MGESNGLGEKNGVDEKRATTRGNFRATQQPQAGLVSYWTSTENTLRNTVRRGDRLEIAVVLRVFFTEIRVVSGMTPLGIGRTRRPHKICFQISECS
jgi:hypothetical protein